MRQSTLLPFAFCTLVLSLQMLQACTQPNPQQELVWLDASTTDSSREAHPETPAPDTGDQDRTSAPDTQTSEGQSQEPTTQERPAEVPPERVAQPEQVAETGREAPPIQEKAPESQPDRSVPPGSKSGCTLPKAPARGTQSTKVVGTGTAASCTEVALRQALQGTGRKVTFSCGGAVTIQLKDTLVLQDDTWLDGGGLVTLDGGGKVRILRTEKHSKVRLQGLTFRRGKATQRDGVTDANGSGGAVYRGWSASLYVSDCRFENNEASAEKGFGGGALATASAGYTTIVRSHFANNRCPLGGAIYSLLSNLTVMDTTFESNDATTKDGGAIYTDGAYVPQGGRNGANDGVIHLCGVRFHKNQAEASGGAGFLFTYKDSQSNKRDRLIIDRCEFRANRVRTASPGLGGAIRIDADATVTATLFAHNENAGQGGAIWMGRGPAHFENVTFFANHATKWGGAISYGSVPLTFLNCTFAYNIADAGSDGLFGNDGAVTAHNSLFVQNGKQASKTRHCRRTLKGARNIAFPAQNDDACGASATHSDPKADSSLKDNGGFTQTLAIQAGSPAENAGASCPNTDQRGNPRNTQRCDIGAYER